MVLRSLLRAVEVPYTWAVRWRNRRYDRARTEVHRVGVPVVSVGNLTLGGTGKTPMVKWLARYFMDRDVKVALVSRGYGAVAGERNDEARELEQALPEVPHVQSPDRARAARQAIAEHAAELILLDDGFQHRRLARDLDIVLLDALEPFGFSHVFPRGMLREPKEGLARADVICLTRADAVSADDRTAIRCRAREFAPKAVWCEVAHAPSGLINAAGDALSLDTLRGRHIAVFCGIGNPAGFRHTLTGIQCNVVAWREFPDHHAYTESDVKELSELAQANYAEMLVCTHKDLVKIQQSQMEGPPLWAITIDMQFLAGESALEEQLRRIVAKPFEVQS